MTTDIPILANSVTIILAFIASLSNLMGQSYNESIRTNPHSFQSYEKSFAKIDSVIFANYESKDFELVAGFCDSIIKDLNDINIEIVLGSSFLKWKYHHEEITQGKETVLIYSHDDILDRIKFRIEFFKELRDDLLMGNQPERIRIVYLVRFLFHARYAQVFRDAWIFCPELQFTERFTEELKACYPSFRKAMEDESWLGEMESGFEFQKENVFVRRFPSDDEITRPVGDGFSSDEKAVHLFELDLWNQMKILREKGGIIIFM